MTDSEILKIYPTYRLKPYDGMPVTATVWASAHEEHRSSRRAHDILFHGSGIITGLDVIANDPPNQFVYISPGMAVDPVGNIIVLNETVAYDFGGTSEGPLFLVIGTGEREVKGAEEDVIRIQNEFVIAARPGLPKRPVVELARITIQKAGQAIKNPNSIQHPKMGELDLRYRSQLVSQNRKIKKIAVCSIGLIEKNIIQGWDHLVKNAEKELPIQFVVDNNVELTTELSEYDMVFVSGKGVFKFDDSQSKALESYHASGKVLVLDSLDGSAEKSFQPILERLKISLISPTQDSEIMSSPHLFTSIPNGFAGNQIKIAPNIIFSASGYGLAWAGKFGEGSGSRSAIRDAHEWGVNLLQFCLK